MRCWWDGRKVELNKDSYLVRLESSLKTMCKLLSDGKQGFWVELGIITKHDKVDEPTVPL